LQTSTEQHASKEYTP
jgi:hypothetical protein